MSTTGYGPTGFSLVTKTINEMKTALLDLFGSLFASQAFGVVEEDVDDSETEVLLVEATGPRRMLSFTIENAGTDALADGSVEIQLVEDGPWLELDSEDALWGDADFSALAASAVKSAVFQIPPVFAVRFLAQCGAADATKITIVGSLS